jgi:hypothetical protein
LSIRHRVAVPAQLRLPHPLPHRPTGPVPQATAQPEHRTARPAAGTLRDAAGKCLYVTREPRERTRLADDRNRG